MRLRVAFFLLLWSVLLLTQLAFSGTWTDTRVTNYFSITGTTVSTSTGHGGHGTTYYRVSGSADISGTADPMDTGDAYEATMWLEVSGKDVGGVPGRDNIDTTKNEGGVYQDTHSSSTGKVFYKRHNVSSASNAQVLPGTYESNQLSDSVSHYFVDSSYSSPTGLSASPYCYGSLSGDIGKAAGSGTLTTLTFRSGDNDSDGDSPDDGTEMLASEICNRKQHCQKPFTAKRAFDHRVACGEKRWGDNKWLGAFNIWKKKKEDCPGYRWTCSPLACDFTASHVSSSELHLEEKYVDANGNTVDPSTVLRDCGHALTASGDHSLQVSCSEDTNCISTNFYLCQHDVHEYSDPTAVMTYACGVHSGPVSASSDHDPWPHISCGHSVYTCDWLSHAWQALCPDDENGVSCSVNGGVHWICNPHACEYPSAPAAPSAPSTTPSNTPAPVGNHPCGMHLSSVSGVHTLQLSCPSTDSYGNPCTVTHFYGCVSHACVYAGGSAQSSVGSQGSQTQSSGNTNNTPGNTNTGTTNNNPGNTNTGNTNPGNTTPGNTNNNTAPGAPSQPSPPSQMYGGCGVHLITESGDHSLQASCSVTNSRGDLCLVSNFYACVSHVHVYPSQTYHACGVHLSSAGGDHSLQASCSRDTACISQNFYFCQHDSHEYPRPTAVCSAGHTYYTDRQYPRSQHGNRTCSRCSQTYQKCSNHGTACQGSAWHTDTALTCARSDCDETVSTEKEHKIDPCGHCGAAYWTCIEGAIENHETTYTCRREGCGVSFTKCSNGPSACVRAGKASNYHWASE